MSKPSGIAMERKDGTVAGIVSPVYGRPDDCDDCVRTMHDHFNRPEIVQEFLSLNQHPDATPVVATSAVDATLWPLVGSTATLEVQPVAGTVTATNPKYSGDVLITEYPVFDTEVGELATVGVTWDSAGPLTRSTS